MKLPLSIQDALEEAGWTATKVDHRAGYGWCIEAEKREGFILRGPNAREIVKLIQMMAEVA